MADGGELHAVEKENCVDGKLLQPNPFGEAPKSGSEKEGLKTNCGM